MYDTLTSNNHEDFRQRYQGSYGWLSVDGKEQIVYITKVSAAKVMFNTVKDRDFFAFVDQDVKFKFLPIKRGWYNGISRPCLLTRIAARQYCRGISSSNTTCMTLSYGNILKPIPISSDVLEAVFNKDHQNFKYQNSTPFVLSKFFSFGSWDGDTEATMKRPLFFFEAKVAWQEKDSKVAFSADWQHIKQEFADTVRRLNLSDKIEVV